MISMQKIYQILFLFLLVSCHVSNASCSHNSKYHDDAPEEKEQELMLEQTFILGQRPLQVQQAVDNAFRGISTNFGWGFYNGKKEFYNLMNLDETKLLKKLAFQENEKNEVYILDAGCSHGGWGEAVVEFLQTECAESPKQFHIFSVTGGHEQYIFSEPGKIEQEDRIYKEGNITHYRYNEFKLEDIDMAFKLKGQSNLTEKFDLIVSRAALMHLVDPFGTLSQLYNLLSPSGGMLLADGFKFSYETDPENYLENTDYQTNLFATSSATALFTGEFNGTSFGHFMLLRTNNEPLNLPIDYTNQVKYLKDGKCVPVFKKSPNILKKEQQTFQLIDIGKKSWPPLQPYYCEKKDKKAQALMQQLVDQQLFIKPVKIKAASDILDDPWESDNEEDLK